ncbi:MAG: SusC/RagA family TonB-linked outer membrane protein [Bacteroidales bacterium]|nr:SusC/RagA family TonB-linked outer membrane protein [Bacteroidales bacterium]
MKKLLLMLTFICITMASFAQQKVEGKVKDASGEPLIGVSVYPKGYTGIGTITDIEGLFSLSVPDEATVMVFSCIGFETEEMAIDGKSELFVTMRDNTQEMDEVVVIGYGTQRKGDVTSSVGSVKKEDFVGGAVKDAGQMIQGKVAGLVVSNPSGDPTSGTQIALRGRTTINGASGNPLVLVDGIPGSLTTVAPEDIESVDVLKDGSAAAIYGSRGTNGVILITTKKSKGNSINEVEYSTYISTSTISKKLEVCDALDYIHQIENGQRDASWDKGGSTNWLSEISRVPFSHVHNLSFRGGNSKTNYVMNLNYRSIQGIFKRSDNKKFQGRAEINHSMFNDKLRFNVGIIGNQTNYTATANGGSFNSYIYRQCLIHNPTESVKNADGSWNENTGLFEYANPLALLYETDGEQDLSQTIYNGSVVFNPIKSLTFKFLASYDKGSQYGGYYETTNHISTLRDNQNGFAGVGANTGYTKMTELTAQWSKRIKDHNIMVLGGYSYQKVQVSNEWAQNHDFPTNLYSYNNIGVGQALKDGKGAMSSDKWSTNLVGFFGRATYAYKDKYLLMAAVRHEEASQLAGTDNPWGTFPSVSLGWVLTKENFMQSQTLFDNIKLRAGYGVTGSQPNASFLGVSLMTYGDYFYYNGRWIPSLVPTQNANKEIEWEEKHETNIGVDFSMWEGRFTGSIDLYDRTIKGLLYYYAVPSPPNLYTGTMANVGKMNNKGIEILLAGSPIKKDNFLWNTSMTFSTNKNVLKSLSNDLYETTSDYFVTGWIQEPIKTESHIVKIGETIGNFFGFKVVDVDEDGKWIYEDKDGNLVGYDDFDHSFENKKEIGNGLPKYHLGWTNNFSYKNWDATITQRGAFGFQIINVARMYYENLSRQDWNRLKSAYDPVFGKATLNSTCAEEFNSYYVEDGDYWKIDNITIGYTFKNIAKHIKSIRLYVSGNNLLTITGYKGIDPEVSMLGLNPGYDDRDKYPSTRSFVFGASFNF